LWANDLRRRVVHLVHRVHGVRQKRSANAFRESGLSDRPAYNAHGPGGPLRVLWLARVAIEPRIRLPTARQEHWAYTEGQGTGAFARRRRIEGATGIQAHSCAGDRARAQDIQIQTRYDADVRTARRHPPQGHTACAVRTRLSGLSERGNTITDFDLEGGHQRYGT
jgi:hypothetical protein